MNAFAACAIAGPLLVLASTVAWIADQDPARYVLQFHGAAVAALGLIAVIGGPRGHFGAPAIDADGGVSGTLAPSLPGLLGPVSMIGIGIIVWCARTVSRWCAATLVAAAALFPVSRIGDIGLLALVVEVLMCAALIPLGPAVLRARPGAMTEGGAT